MDIDVEVGDVPRRPWFERPWIIAGSALAVVALVAGGSFAVVTALRDETKPGEVSAAVASESAAASDSAQASASDVDGASTWATAGSDSDSIDGDPSDDATDPEAQLGGPVTIGESAPWQFDCSHLPDPPDTYEYIYMRRENYVGVDLIAASHPGDEYRTLLASGEVIEVDGVTPGTANDTAAVVAWSPNSRYVAWVRTYPSTLTVLDLQTGESHSTTGSSLPNSMLAWSDDSKHLAYLATSDSQEVVMDMAVATGASTTVLADAFIGGFAWSPDGSSLAISHAPLPASSTKRADASTIDIVTGSETTRTGIRGMSPAWSPDGKSLFFLADADGDGRWGAVRYLVATTDVTAVTKETEFSGFLTGAWQRFTPVFSADGSRFAMLAPSGTGKTNVGAYLVSPDGTGAARVSDAFSLYAPVWNAQGTKFATAGRKISVMDATGVLLLDEGGAESPDIAWTSDGTSPIVWGSFCTDGIVRLQVVTGQRERAPINFGGGWIERATPHVSPDGSMAVADLKGPGYAGFGLYLFEMP